MKNFFRKVAFGLKPEEKAPSDPLTWAQKQVETIPELNWKGKHIYSEKEMRKYWIQQRVTEETTFRKKYKNDPDGLRRAEKQLENDTGARYWPTNEICMRHAEGIRSDNPVLAKLWYFWTNHFTISDTQSLPEFSTGAYHREFIRANMDKTFETMVQEATVAWPMIMHLDNKDNIGPKSESARQEWRRKEKRPATLNENHARELMELHTISPEAGYTQEDVQELAKIMTGWRPKWTKKSDQGTDVRFMSERHEPGKKNVLGKTYKKGRKSLKIVIKDLVNHPSCREFIATKLCRYLITDHPTKQMIAPIIKARPKDLLTAITLIFLLNALAIIIFPIIVLYLGLSQDQFGAWAAMAIHDTSSVIGAAMVYGEEAVETAATLKLGRTLWLIPLILLLSYKYQDKSSTKFQLHFFVIFFIIAIAIGSFIDLNSETLNFIKLISQSFLLLGLFCIGSQIDKKVLSNISVKPLQLALILWIIVIPSSYLLIQAII